MKYRFQTRYFQPIIMFFIGIIHCAIFTLLLINILKNFDPFSSAGVLFIVIYILTIMCYILAIGYLFQWAEYDNDIIRFRCIYLVFKEIRIKDIKSIEIINIKEKSPQRTIQVKIIVIKVKEIHNHKYKYLMNKKTLYGVIYHTEENLNKLKEIALETQIKF